MSLILCPVMQHAMADRTLSNARVHIMRPILLHRISESDSACMYTKRCQSTQSIVSYSCTVHIQDVQPVYDEHILSKWFQLGRIKARRVSMSLRSEFVLIFVLVYLNEDNTQSWRIMVYIIIRRSRFQDCKLIKLELAAGKHNYFNGRRAWKCSFMPTYHSVNN
jgi:hypothetical protein